MYSLYSDEIQDTTCFHVIAPSQTISAFNVSSLVFKGLSLWTPIPNDVKLDPFLLHLQRVLGTANLTLDFRMQSLYDGLNCTHSAFDIEIVHGIGVGGMGLNGLTMTEAVEVGSSLFSFSSAHQ